MGVRRRVIQFILVSLVLNFLVVLVVIISGKKSKDIDHTLDSPFFSESIPLDPRISPKYDIFESTRQSKRIGKYLRFTNRISGRMNDLLSQKDEYLTYKNDCMFCEYPTYTRAWFFNPEYTGFADAFLASYNGEYINHVELVIFSHVNPNLWKTYSVDVSKLKGEFSFINEKFSNIRVGAGTDIECDVFQFEYVISLRCLLDDNMLALIKGKGCFYVNFFDGNHVLIKPILVRDCTAQNYINTKTQLQLHNPNNVNNMIQNIKMDIGFCIMITTKSCKWMLEWIEYHLIAGIDHIYVYLHLGKMNVIFDTDIFVLLDPYIEENKVTIFLWNFTHPYHTRYDSFIPGPWTGDQRAAYTDCLNRFGFLYKWMGFFDDDEYLTPYNTTLVKVLEKYGNMYDIHDVKVFPLFIHWNKSSNSEMCIERYPYVDEVLPIMRKSVVKSNACMHYDNHECGLSRFGVTRPKWKDLVYYLYRNRAINGYATLDYKNEACLMHYFYRKYDKYNPIVNNIDKDNLSIFNFLNVLKRNLQIRKKMVNWDDFEYDFEEWGDKEKDEIVYKVNVYSKHNKEDPSAFKWMENNKY